MAVADYTAHYRLPIPQFNSVPWHQQWEDSLRAVDEALYLSTVTAAPAWQNSHVYAIGNMALDTLEGTLWVVSVAHTSGASPQTFAQYRAANPTHWQGISTLPTFRGNWVTGTTYNKNDFVLSGSQYAVANVSHIAGATFAADLAALKWTVLIDVGQAFVGINDLPTASVAAANTIDLGATAASRMLITGVAPGGTVSNFGTAADVFKILQFGTVGNTIIHNGVSLQLPDGQDIVAQANDIFYFSSNSAGNWMLWGMQRKFTQTDFDTMKEPATTTYTGVVELATNAEATAQADATRVLTPSNLAALIASATARGLIELATDAEANAHVDATRALTPSNLAAMTATANVTGLVELATAAEVQALTDTQRAITPAGLAALIATDIAKGIIEIATNAETALGTDATRAVSPAGLASLIATSAVRGLMRFATNAEAIALSVTDAAITPDNLGNVQATTTAKGIVELADDTETAALATGARAVTPSSLGNLSSTTTQRGISRFATSGEAAAMGATTIGVTPQNLTDALATRSEIEAGTTNHLLSSINAKYPMGVAKAWGVANTTGTLQYGFNMSAVVDAGVGVIQFAIDTDMSNTLYPTFGIALNTGATDMSCIADAAPAVGAFTMRTFNQAGVLTDPTRFLGVAFGQLTP